MRKRTKLKDENYKDEQDRAEQDHRQPSKRFLLNQVLPAEFDIGSGRDVDFFEESAFYLVHRRAEIATFQSRGDGREIAQVVALDFVGRLSGFKLGDARTRHGAAVRRSHQETFQFVAVLAALRRITHADRYQPVVADHPRGYFAIENPRLQIEHVLHAEARQAGLFRIDAEIARRADGEGVVFDINHAFDAFFLQPLGDGGGGRFVALVVRMINLDLNWFRRHRQIADQVFENVWKLDLDDRLGFGDLVAQFFDHLVGRLIAIAFKLDQKIARVRLGDRQRQARPDAQRVAFDFRRLFQHLLDVAEHAMRLFERGPRGHNIIKHERALIHLRQKTDPQIEVQNDHRNDYKQRRQQRHTRAPQCPAQRLFVARRQTAQDAAFAGLLGYFDLRLGRPFMALEEHAR